jgi:RNA polymerase sigma-70 factor (ECF subfamily)
MARKRHLRSVDAAPTPDGLAAAVPAARTYESEPTTHTGFIPLPSAEELEKLLDEESDEEFGQTETDIASSTKRAVLKEWSAADFANIYTRYRPHLERHARRWLRNQTQVDEVVQDAFLYLMVTLPELDSELGVLRFLKWKVKNLCIDVIRASNRAQFNSIDEVAEPESNDPEIGSELEHAEDAAIVRLALSKLNPRHREVLLASMYEEKSTREIAAQVGLSENATLQLIHRARAAFKKALLGDDVNTEGMSVQAILSVAARKAAADVKKAGAQAMIFIVFLAVAVGGFLNFNRPASVKPVAEAPQSSSSNSNVSPNTITPSIAGPAQPTESVSTGSAATASTGLVVSTVSNIKPIQSTDGSVPGTEEDGRIATITQSDLNALTSASTDAFFTRASSEANQPGVQSLYLHADNEVSATLDFHAADPASISNVKVTLVVGGEQYLVFLPNGTLDRTFVNGNATYTYVGAIKQLIDGQNRVITGSLLNSQFVHITITVQNVSDKVIATAISVGAEY